MKNVDIEMAFLTLLGSAQGVRLVPIPELAISPNRMQYSAKRLVETLDFLNSIQNGTKEVKKASVSVNNNTLPEDPWMAPLAEAMVQSLHEETMRQREQLAKDFAAHEEASIELEAHGELNLAQLNFLLRTSEIDIRRDQNRLSEAPNYGEKPFVDAVSAILTKRIAKNKALLNLIKRKIVELSKTEEEVRPTSSFSGLDKILIDTNYFNVTTEGRREFVESLLIGAPYSSTDSVRDSVVYGYELYDSYPDKKRFTVVIHKPGFAADFDSHVKHKFEKGQIHNIEEEVCVHVFDHDYENIFKEIKKNTGHEIPPEGLTYNIVKTTIGGDSFSVLAKAQRPVHDQLDRHFSEEKKSFLLAMEDYRNNIVGAASFYEPFKRFGKKNCEKNDFTLQTISSDLYTKLNLLYNNAFLKSVQSNTAPLRPLALSSNHMRYRIYDEDGKPLYTVVFHHKVDRPKFEEPESKDGDIIFLGFFNNQERPSKPVYTIVLITKC